MFCILLVKSSTLDELDIVEPGQACAGTVPVFVFLDSQISNSQGSVIASVYRIISVWICRKCLYLAMVVYLD